MVSRVAEDQQIKVGRKGSDIFITATIMNKEGLKSQAEERKK